MENNSLENTVFEKLQSVQLEIASVIKNICEKNGLRYFLAYGTLIGAIRHNGFIPWDDDIDIMMPYPDLLEFERLCKIEMPTGYFYQSMETDPQFRYPIVRVRKNGTLLIEENNAGRDIHHGIFVDIYPMFGSAPKKSRKLQMFRAMKRALYLVDEPVKNHGKIMKWGSSFLLKLKSKKGKDKAQKKLFEKISSYPYDESDQVVCLNGSLTSMKAVFDRSWFGAGVSHKFEDTEFMIPVDYDKVLKIEYGDYMELPPEKERKPHHDFLRIDFEHGSEKVNS